jgi:hypothetical protein
MAVGIQSFADLPGIATIVGLGRVRWPRGRAVEAEIAVELVTQLESKDSDRSFDLHQRYVGIGQMEMLRIGSRWNNGKFVSDARHTAYTMSASFAGLTTIGGGDAGLPIGRIASAPAIRLMLSPIDGKTHCGAKFAIFPQSELIRHLFAISSDLMLQAVDGVRSSAAAADRDLWDRDKSHVQGTDVVIHAWRKLSPAEARCCADILTNELVRKAHDRIAQTMKASPNWSAGHEKWLSTWWPAKDPAEICFEGQWITTDSKQSYFLITRLRSLRYERAYNRVIVSHPFEEVEGEKLITGARRLPAIAREAFYTTGIVPTSARQPTTTKTSRDEPDASGPRIEYVARDERGRGRSDMRSEDDVEADDRFLATAGRDGGGDHRVGKGVIQRVDGATLYTRPGLRAEALAKTWAALRVACNANNWTLTPHPDRPASSSGCPFNFETDMLIATVTLPAGQIVVADVGSFGNKQRSLGLLVPTARAKTALDIWRIRKAAEEHGGRWRRSKMPGAPLEPIKVAGFDVWAVNRPPAVWDEPEAYKAMLIARILSAFDR